MTGEAPDIREREECPDVAACHGACDQHRDLLALGSVMKRFIADEETYVGTDTGDVCLDGWATASPEELAVIEKHRWKWDRET